MAVVFARNAPNVFLSTVDYIRLEGAAVKSKRLKSDIFLFDKQKLLPFNRKRVSP